MPAPVAVQPELFDSGLHCGIMVAEKPMTIEDAILEKVRALSPDQQAELLAVADSLAKRTKPRLPLRSPEGWVGAGYDGVQVFTPAGERIGQIVLPEACANLCFGGSKRNLLFMAASQSLYAVYVETRGAHIC